MLPWLFKMLVKGLARRHGFAASFMAKPYEDYPGSGLHAFLCADKRQQTSLTTRPQGTAIMRQRGCGLYERHGRLRAGPFAPHATV